MPRKPRFNLVGTQHVIQRGNNREACFYSEQDYRRYLDDLQNSASTYDCRVHAYVKHGEVHSDQQNMGQRAIVANICRC